MRDLIGRTLGHYRIVEKIGEGGMGEVYRAHDERLDRDVAIKVLPEAVAEDAQRLSRFEREAKLLASLSHQNIATLYGLEDEESHRFLVMELVEGESLAHVIARGPVPAHEAIPIALEIAKALEAAHEHGIVHRDLKPANVMVDSEGQVKVLDFGLAKALDPEGSGPQSAESLAESPTLTADLTRGGVLLGTAAYMSPEQVRGKPIDKRADIWAFGCTLYEMLTGMRTFQGTTSTDVLAEIIKEEPDWGILPIDTPLPILRLLRRCLSKDPRNRLHDIGDARLEMELPESTEQLSAGSRDSLGKTPFWRHVLPWGVAAAAILGVVVTHLVEQRSSTDAVSAQVLRTAIVLPESEPVALAETAPFGVGRPSIALSPDGTTLVYVSKSDGTACLFQRQLDKYSTSRIPGTEGAFNPFFSPDGGWVGFFTETTLKKVTIPGGQVVTLCEARNTVGGSWGGDGHIYFASEFGLELSRVSASGGPPEGIAGRGSWPRLLPDNKTLLITRGHALAPSICVMQLESGEERVVIDRGGDARYLKSGHLIFGRAGQVHAAAFDLDRMIVTGPSVPVIDGVRTELREGLQAAFSQGGTVIYLPGPPGTEVKPVWIDMMGGIEATGIPSGVYTGPRFSSDGGRLAIVSAEINADIWIHDLIRESALRISLEGQHRDPVWTPDDSWIIYRKVDVGIFRRRANGIGEEEKLSSLDGFPLSVTPDGKKLIIYALGEEGLTAIALDKGGTQGVSVGGTKSSSLERLSPDGRWMALTSSETGRFNVYVEPYPPTGERWMISTDGGEEPVWSPGMNEIFYRYGNKWMAVAVKTQPEFSAGRTRLLFERDLANSPGYSYDVHPDGNRFLVLQRGRERATRLHVIDNWFEELNRLVPVN